MEKPTTTDDGVMIKGELHRWGEVQENAGRALAFETYFLLSPDQQELVEYSVMEVVARLTWDDVEDLRDDPREILLANRDPETREYHVVEVGSIRRYAFAAAGYARNIRIKSSDGTYFSTYLQQEDGALKSTVIRLGAIEVSVGNGYLRVMSGQREEVEGQSAEGILTAIKATQQSIRGDRIDPLEVIEGRKLSPLDRIRLWIRDFFSKGRIHNVCYDQEKELVIVLMYENIPASKNGYGALAYGIEEALGNTNKYFREKFLRSFERLAGTLKQTEKRASEAGAQGWTGYNPPH